MPPLPVLSGALATSPSDLLRAFRRLMLHRARQLGEAVTLPALPNVYAVAAPDLAHVGDANCVLDAETGDDAVIAAVEEHYRTLGVAAPQWMASCLTGQTIASKQSEILLNRNYAGRVATIHHLLQAKTQLPGAPPAVSILPARAAQLQLRALEERIASWAGRTAAEHAEASMRRLDDPHLDALVALRGGEAVARIGVLSVGDTGLIADMHVDPICRGQGIGQTLLGRALEICGRSAFRHVFTFAPQCTDHFYRSFGFEALGEVTFWERNQYG